MNLSKTERSVFREVLINTFLAPVEGIFSIQRNILNVYKENEELRVQIASMQLQVDALLQYKEQNHRLRKMLDLKFNTVDSLISGEVIGRTPNRFQTTWKINLGSADSILVNMPVISQYGLVGRVSKVYPYTSLIQLLIDPLSKVSVINHRTRDMGMLESFGHGKLMVLYPSHIQFKQGDTIVSSGMGGVFPTGLKIGTLNQKVLNRTNVLVGWELRPFENFSRVEEVFIVKRQSNWDVHRVE